jgi:hypothetical protein
MDVLTEEYVLRLENWGNEKAAQGAFSRFERLFTHFSDSSDIFRYKVFKNNSTYIYFHSKYTSREAYINRWKVSCAVAAATGTPLPDEPTNLPTYLDIPTGYAKNFILPGAQSDSK